MTAGKSKPGECPSPATAARIMPPPSTGCFLNPAGPAITAQAAPHTGSTPRPPHRKRRGQAAHGLVLMTQETPSSDSPQGVDASTSASSLVIMRSTAKHFCRACTLSCECVAALHVQQVWTLHNNLHESDKRVEYCGMTEQLLHMAVLRSCLQHYLAL